MISESWNRVIFIIHVQIIFLQERETIIMSKKEKESSSFTGSTGLMAGAIIIVAIIAVVALLFATGIAGGSGATDANAVPPNECGAAVMLYANTNLIAAGSPATLVSVTEQDGMYLVTAKNQARTFGFYATKDCNLLFVDPYNLKAPYTPKATSTPKANHVSHPGSATREIGTPDNRDVRHVVLPVWGPGRECNGPGG